MNLDNCTTMLNRSKHCSTLKKRKSSCKENTITVKLKRYTLKGEDKNLIQTMTSNTDSVDDIKNKNYKMCLICRTQNDECASDRIICNSMATLNRQQQRHQPWKTDNDSNNTTTSRKSQNLKKTSSTSSIPSDTSPLSSSSPTPTSKWNVLEIANQKSQSQRNAVSVSCFWNDSCSAFSNSSSMPSCQLQSTSSSSSISPPILSKTPSTDTSLLSSPQQQQQLSSAACFSSSAEAAAASASTIKISSSASLSSSKTTTTSTTVATASSLLSSSRTNTSTTPLPLPQPHPQPLTLPLPSCINSSTSLSNNSKSCASLLRTLALVAVILEKCFIAMFGTRHIGMPLEHDINNSNQVTVSIQKSKRSHMSSGLPKYPIMIIFLSLSFMTLLMLPMTTNAADTEVALGRKEEVCKSRDIRNSVDQFALLQNCTVIEGFLLISLIEGHNHSAYEKYSFPLLTEVTDFVMIYRVNGLRTLSTLFPNLSIIRGKELFEGFGLVLYENTHLEEVGLTSLATIARGAIRIEKNPALCFVETIDWTRITFNMSNDQNFFLGNKAAQECPGCPDGEINDNEAKSKDCNGKCWNSMTCQKMCPEKCKYNCNDKLECCHESCIGGCANNDPTKCKNCRHFTKMTTCIDKCPKDFFTYLERRCVTAETCKQIGTKLEGSKQVKLVPFNGACSVRCPPGYNKNDVTLTCQKCDGKCVKSCDGGFIDSIAAARVMHGCTRIVNSGLSISIKGGGRHLMEELEMGLSSIEEIDTYLKVHRTYGVTSLEFFKNLKRIRGKSLESDKFALYILENQDLERIWGKNQVQMDEGRVFFHFNPKLCYSEIEKLRSSLKNKTQPFDKNEVATDSNGSKGSCNTEVLNVEVVRVLSSSAHVKITNPIKFEDDRVLIGYQFFYSSDRNASIFGQTPCDETWKSSDPSKETDYVFLGLLPFTQYAFYVKTQTISSELRNGQSPIAYFRTKPAQPKPVHFLKAVANSSSEIIIRWIRPQETNGNLTKYIINVTLDANDHQKLKKRNFCKDPIKKAASSEVELPFPNEKADQGLLSTNGTANCKCEKNVTRKDGVNPQLQDSHYDNVISFENNVQNFVYVKQSNDSQTQSDGSHQRRRRAVEKSETTTTAAPAPQSKTESNSKLYEVDASVTEFVLRNLTHFSQYTIKVQACRAPEVGATANECSSQSIAYSRTNKLPDVDIVRNVQLELEHSNTTRRNIRIKWDPPERPNNLIVSYTIIYAAVDSEDAAIEKRCISPLDSVNFTNSYVIYGLPSGNYSIIVQANSLAGEGIESPPAFIYIPPNRITWQTITIICVCVFIFICFVAFTVYYIRKKFLAPPSDLKIFPTVNPYYISMQYLPDEWEVPRDKIIQLGALGQGSFGMVYEGILKNFNSQEDTPCAIKTVNENATDRERLNFLKEASVMKQFNTHHVVRLLGVCSRGQPALVIMELMKNGDLKAYLRQHRPDAEQNHGEPAIQPPTLDRIYQIAIEIADGMAYLAAKKYVHRDLAARNCMVAADLTVKIGDFGMTRDVYETDYYRKGTKGLLPVRWMSPESLKDGIFSSASDVFSYGVVLWEMATLASQPYQGFSNDQVLRFVIDGGVMERPENCPDKLYKVMQKCWQHRPSARPSFMEIIRFLLDSADPKFQEVSFYHSAEAKDMHDQMHPEHDMDDVTTPLRVGEFDYKLNIDDNSSVEPHESPQLDEDDDDDDNIQSHSPYSLGSAIIISSTPGNHSKYSPNTIMNQSNPSLSLPSTSAAAARAAASIAAVSGYTENAEYVQPDMSYDYNAAEDQQQSNTSGDSNTTTTAQKSAKNHPSLKYHSNLKRAVASTVQNVSNSLVPLNFLHRRLFKNNNKQSGKQQKNKSAKSEISNNNGSNNNSNKSSIASNVELGSAGSRSFFAGLTPSHTSKNPNYQILDESLNVSARPDEQGDKLPPTTSRSRTESCSSAASGKSNRNQGNNTMQPRQQEHQTTEQCNLNKDNTNYLLSSSNFKDTKSSQNQNQPTISLAHELFLNSGVSNPISHKDNKNTNSEASSAVISTSNSGNTPIPTSTIATSKTKTPYQLKEKWLQQQIPSKAVPPNGYIGLEG